MIDNDTVPIVHDDDALSNIRRHATGRRHAMTTWHPDTANVDPETFWLIWRDGVNWSMRTSASISPMLQTAAELIVLMARTHDESDAERAWAANASLVAENERLKAEIERSLWEPST